MAETPRFFDDTVVPFVDLARMHEPLAEEFLEDVASIVTRNDFVNGRAVGDFEREFSAHCYATSCVAVASGLDALRLSLLAAGVRDGAEVVVPANTFIATFEAVTQAGAVPVVVDVTHADYNMDVDAAAAAVTDRTEFLLPVHLYGQMADMRSIQRLARACGLGIIEDACQAHGASRDGIHPGVGTTAACFSFYPGKNLGALGDGGAVVTSDDSLAKRISALREHGQTSKYHHEFVGYTARLDTMQAAFLLRKLPYLDAWNAERREAAERYTEGLSDVGDLRLPAAPPESVHVWHLYVIRTADPVLLARWLAGEGIATGRHYPEPPHLAGAYEWLGHRAGSFPVAEAISRECLSLPMFPGISESEQEVVVDAVRRYFDNGVSTG